ncbi:MAG TPA: sulfatase-like hydrolase/transferase [Bryobacteraceae bacterium]|jgi:arylsulfatase A-like enzyme|nr:sulfatase-like hydrolase/transferase [Bryobacteraceae bacterium]
MLSRRDFLATSGATVLTSNLSGAYSQRPNFIVFLTDDLGCHDLACLGSHDLKTPNIDRLAATGARFTNWYAAAPVCAPSRAALLTGRYPIRAGVPNNGPALPESERTIAACLKEAGYGTAICGKWHLGSTPATAPNARGFNRFFGFHSGCIDYYSHRYYWGEPKIVNYHDLWSDGTEVFEDGEYSTELFAREAVQFIRQNHDKPFFLYVPFNGVHYPMHAPKRYVDDFRELPFERRIYAAMLAAVDEGVGEVMRTLREYDLTKDTLVMFTADNGATREKRAGLNQQIPNAGHNGILRGYKFSVFDGGMHPPMIMSWPGVIPPGQVIDEVGCHIDILPTLCQAAHAKVPDDRIIDGRNALPMATARAKSPHEAIYWASNNQLAVRKGEWKLVKNGIVFDGTPEGSRPLTGDNALFLSNLDDDPGETKNRRHEAPKLVDELETQATEWLREVSKNR